MNDTITAVPGVEVGHWSDPIARTGCTVVVLPEPNIVAAEVRGAAPGSRETALLQPGMRIEQAQAIVLTGGSAFGLAAADGVVRALEADGRGHETPVARVPIVPAAVIFDLFEGDATIRPGPDHGEAAYHAASSAPVENGLVGAGTGATVSKWRGLEHMQPGGLGSAVRRVGRCDGGCCWSWSTRLGTSSASSGEPLTGGPHEPGPPVLPPGPMVNTTLVVVATDFLMTRNELTRIAVRTHDALAACIRPVHTRFDGDIAYRGLLWVDRVRRRGGSRGRVWRHGIRHRTCGARIHALIRFGTMAEPVSDHIPILEELRARALVCTDCRSVPNPHPGRVRSRGSQRQGDVGRRGSREERGSPGRALRRCSGQASRPTTRRDRSSALRGVYRQCPQVPPARESRPASR